MNNKNNEWIENMMETTTTNNNKNKQNSHPPSMPMQFPLTWENWKEGIERQRMAKIFSISQAFEQERTLVLEHRTKHMSREFRRV